MNRINDCFEHIKVIRGVNNGRISNEQVEYLIVRYQLDASEKQNLLNLLHKGKVYPIPEEEFPNSTDRTKETNPKKKLTEEKRVEILDKRFQSLCKDFKENPECLKQYLEEIPILKRAIAKQREKNKGKSDWIIALAIMKISDYRVRERRKRGWGCGTYMSQCRALFQRWLNIFFLEEELEEIVQCCSKDEELSFEELKILLMFLDMAPRAIVIPYRNELFEFIEETE